MACNGWMGNGVKSSSDIQKKGRARVTTTSVRSGWRSRSCGARKTTKARQSRYDIGPSIILSGGGNKIAAINHRRGTSEPLEGVYVDELAWHKCPSRRPRQNVVVHGTRLPFQPRLCKNNSYHDVAQSFRPPRLGRPNSSSYVCSQTTRQAVQL